ncbi:MAG: hypothetical protein QOG28_1248 [Trebonia sp.]|jgi:hypothetical protein|nr:hypothetical protein [Trebonia sp.]
MGVSAAYEGGEVPHPALMDLIRSCFARTQTWLQAGKYLNALVRGLPSRHGWTITEQAGDRTPARAQRLLNRAWHCRDFVTA